MLVPVRWLNEYVNINDISSKELSDSLTLSGSNVESIESVDKGIEKVVVGKIKKIEEHPDADKLVVTKVDVGEEELQIVTGAKNINEGDYIPVALHGSKLPGGVKIKKGKLRGIESNGMLCSAQELGIEDDLIPKEIKNGIYILDKDYPLGKDIKEVLNIDGEVIEFEITPNRPDCLSIVGMARETAATFNKELNYPEINIKNEVENIDNYMKDIKIEDEDNCSRYCGRVVKNIKIKPSPLWIQRRLIEAGIRPINNVVDVTNYVMLELGQPLHAFDLNEIEGKQIIVRKAKKGENIVTLDDIERDLEETMLIIADEKKPIAIAGVMGGANSEVSSKTTTILVESANFNGRSVRLTSRELGLRTDASSKFEKDLDPNLCEDACNRVCQILEQIGAGEVVEGIIDRYETKTKERIIKLRPKKVTDLIGIEIEVDKMVEILNRLELCAEKDGQDIKVRVPTFRQDIKIEVDLVEEIGRIYGFHNVEPEPLLGVLTKGEKSYERKIGDIIKSILTNLGLNEITTYSFISPKAYDKINLSKDSIKRNSVELINPLGEDYSVMRTTLLPNMLQVLSRNYNYGVEKAWAYEIGNIFIPTSEAKQGLPNEIMNISIGMYGEKVDFYYIKGIANSIFNRLGIKKYEYIVEDKHNTFHPGRAANIISGNKLIGTLGEIHPDVLDNYGCKERVYAVELDLEVICSLTNLNRKYSPIPKYPSISRDIALVLDEKIMVKQIEKIIKDTGKAIVEDIKLFDIYQGDQIDEGKKSVAYSIKYRSHEKTLTDDDIASIHDKILGRLKDELGATLR